jgi:hypothetical protein
MTPASAGGRNSAVGKTNPISPGHSQPLAPRQLAAARLLAAGLRPCEICQQLRLSRMGLWKWRQQPAFIAEVHRLHNLMAYASGRAEAGGG